MAAVSFPITPDPEANRLLVENPLALMIGMLLDQQIAIELAFIGPYRLAERLGGPLDAAEIAELAPDRLEEVFQQKPALHRFPASMAKRCQTLCAHLVAEHGGDPTHVWTEAADGADLLRRLKGLPGFGDEKAKIFVALLAKRFSVTPTGWEDASMPFSDSTPRSVADVDSEESLAEVRAWKKKMKAAGKGKQEN